MKNGSGTGASKPTMIDLFSGAGGLSLGFTQAGFIPIFAADMDHACIESYKSNFRDSDVFCGDAREIPSYSDYQIDVVIGGPPCQGFSPLGKMSVRDIRRNEHVLMNSLCMEILRAVRDTGAKAFVMENVPQFLKSKEFALFVEKAEEMEFHVLHDVLNAEDFGVPQRRRRGFTVGIYGSLPSLPVPAFERKTVRDAIGDLPLEPDGKNLHIGRNPTKKSIERYKVIPPGGNRFDLMKKRPDLCPRCWLDKPAGSTDVFGRLEWDKPALTIRTEFFKPEKGRYLHPEADRPITHREAARLQTFPDDFVFCGSKIQIAAQIGNAVPPRLAYHVAKHLMNILKERNAASGGFRSREKETCRTR